MAICNNDNSYKLQVAIQGCYRPLIVRGRPPHEQADKTEFSSRRQFGQKNLDLWVDGSLYPMDPMTNKHPKFSSIKEVLEFLGDGDNGLLGYVRNVERSSRSTGNQVRQQNTMIALLIDRVDDLIRSSAEAEKKATDHVEDLIRSCAEAEKKAQGMTHKFVHQSLITAKAQVYLRNLQQKFKSSTDEHCRRLQSLHKQHEADLAELRHTHEAELAVLRHSLQKATEENDRL